MDIQSHRHQGRAFVYSIVFSILFAFGLIGFVVAKLAGRKLRQGVFTSARQAASATAGYAVKY